MKTFLLRQRIDQAMIPSGCTCHIQSLDLVINMPFKDSIHKEILKYIEIGLPRNQKGNLIKPFKDIICEWIRSSWNSITESTASNTLNVILGYLMPSQNIEDNSIYKHEELAPIFRSKLCDEEISIPVLDMVEHIIDELDDTLLIDE